MRFFCGWMTALIIVGGIGGCSGDNTPPLGRVSGKVTLDGRPLDGAILQFEPEHSGLPTAFGRTDQQGKFELWYSRGHKGASLGPALVRINSFRDADPETGEKARPETIPARYNVKTDLKVEVTRGTQTHNFELKSGGEIVQPNSESTARAVVTGCG